MSWPFDLTSIPPGVEINSVTLKLNTSEEPKNPVPDTLVSLHTLNKDWGEGESMAGGGEGKGAKADSGDATWNFAKYPTIPWSPGGDFNPSPRASTVIGAATKEYSWSSAQMTADVQNWLDNPSTNFGWLLKGDEGAARSVKIFDSRESPNPPDTRPKLIVEYTIQAPPTSTPTPTVRPPGNNNLVYLPVTMGDGSAPSAPNPTPTATPTATAVPPTEYYVSINGIGLENGSYVVSYETSGYTEQLPGRHVHFYFNTVAEVDAGVPVKGPWILYGGPRPFTLYGETDRPAQATAMCARVANTDHSIIHGSGNCFPLPNPLSVSITGIGLENGRYVVNYETSGYTEQLPGRHVHFYFDTVPEADAGVPGKGPWILYGGPRPFTQYGEADRPAQAAAMCARVANADHSIIHGSGNCFTLPSSVNSTVTIPASKDNTLYDRKSSQSLHGIDGEELSNGKGEHFFTGVGSQDPPFARRSVLAFDLTSIPPGADIIDVTLELNMSKTRAGNTPVSLHNLNKDWGESGSKANQGEGQGAVAITGDATWLYNKLYTETWASTGGDFTAVASASTVVGALGKYSWSSAQMTADVQNWLDNPSTNFGWLLKGEENVELTSAKVFDSRENLTASNQPKLIVEYSASAPLTNMSTPTATPTAIRVSPNE